MKKIGISTNILRNPENLEGAVKVLSEVTPLIEIEFEGAAKKILNYDKQDLENWVAKMNLLRDSKNLKYSIHAPYAGSFADIASSDEAIRQSAVNMMQKAMNIAKAIGSEVFTFHPGYLPKIQDSRAFIENVKKSAGEMARKASDLNLILSIENTGTERPKYIVLSDNEYELLYNNFGIKMTMDIIHYTSFNSRVDAAYYERLKNYLPYIANIHFADMQDSNHSHLPLGEGNFPYKEVIQFVYDNGYEGRAIIEETGGHYKTEDYLYKAKEYIRNAA